MYRCADGSLYLAIALDNHWRRFCEVIDRVDLGEAPGFGRNAERLMNRDAVNGVVESWCATRSVYEALGRLLDAGSRTPTRVRHSARPPGADTDDVLSELGFDSDQRAALRAGSVI